MHLRQAALIAFAGVVVSATAAWAEQVEESFQQLVPEASQYLLLVEGGGRYGVSTEVYARYKAVFKGLVKGARITLDLEGTQVTAISAVGQDADNARVSREGVFRRFDDAKQRIWLEGGANFGIGKSLPGKTLARLLTLERGVRLRLVLERDVVVDVALVQEEAQEELAAVKRILDASRPNDEVQLRKLRDPQFLEFKVVTIRAAEVVFTPRVAGRYMGRVTIKRAEIEELVNPAADKRLEGKVAEGDPLPEAERDPFSDARVGDMIGVGFVDIGQLVSLDEQTYSLRSWRNGRWEPEPQTRPRSSAKSIRYEGLLSTETLPLEGGELLLEIKRFRNAREGGLRIEVRLSHSVKSALLVGFEVRFLLSRQPCMEPGSKPDGVVVQQVINPLFVDQRYTLEQKIPDDTFLDARVEVGVLPRHVIVLKGADARAHLITALENWTRPMDDLVGPLRAAAANGDASLCQVVIGKAIQVGELLRLGKNKEAQQVDLELELRRTLDAFGPLAQKLLLELLFTPDRRLRHWQIRAGAIEQAGLPRDLKPLEYKKRILVILTQLKAGIRGEVGQRLFDLFLERGEDFKDDVVQAFRAEPDAAVDALLNVAIDIKDKIKADRAAILLRGLGEPILPALFADLRARKVDPAPLEKALASGTNPDRVVGEAVQMLVRRAYEEVNKELTRQVERAEEARAQGRLEEASKILNEVLARQKGHPGASQLLPRVRVDRGRRLIGEGKRGLGALAIEKAIPELPPGEQIVAKRLLGGLLLDSVEEEIDALVLRAQAHPAGEIVGAIEFAQTYASSGDTTSAFDDWVPLNVGEIKGYARRKVLAEAPTGYRVATRAVPFTSLEEQIQLATSFDASQASRGKILFGRLSAREGEDRYRQGDFEGALTYFDAAKEDAPNDPRLDLYWTCYAKANTTTIGGVSAVVLLGIGFAAMSIFSRPKKVKFSGEYQHYGAERAPGTEGEAPKAEA